MCRVTAQQWFMEVSGGRLSPHRFLSFRFFPTQPRMRMEPWHSERVLRGLLRGDMHGGMPTGAGVM